jgi:hypothetical protein
VLAAKSWQDVWIDDAIVEINKGRTNSFPFAYSKMAASDTTVATFIPPTPTFLGIYPAFLPELAVDYTENLVFDTATNAAQAKTFIRNHDGSSHAYFQ